MFHTSNFFPETVSPSLLVHQISFPSPSQPSSAQTQKPLSHRGSHSCRPTFNTHLPILSRAGPYPWMTPCVTLRLTSCDKKSHEMEGKGGRGVSGDLFRRTSPLSLNLSKLDVTSSTAAGRRGSPGSSFESWANTSCRSHEMRGEGTKKRTSVVKVMAGMRSAGWDKYLSQNCHGVHVIRAVHRLAATFIHREHTRATYPEAGCPILPDH